MPRSLEPEGEAEKPDVTVLWSDSGLLPESCHPSLEGDRCQIATAFSFLLVVRNIDACVHKHMKTQTNTQKLNGRRNVPSQCVLQTTVSWAREMMTKQTPGAYANFGHEIRCWQNGRTISSSPTQRDKASVREARKLADAMVQSGVPKIILKTRH